ncbi:tetratricopeptide repeat protein [Anaerovibrio sp.]|uniref:tetratricopeptide repeat protein n=1 Tax=Anaerovibrio sp. TaxID=1872532 RepID=UPI0025CC87F7|nr:tetratricopeptide repeat protein [Anaerovibrio sp.]
MKLIRFMLILSILWLCPFHVDAKGDMSKYYRPIINWYTLQEVDKVTILGPPTVSPDQMVRYILSRSPAPKLNCSLEELVEAYYTEGAIEGIRPDVALCQALKETDFFRYGNDVSYKQNNYCGLGATGNKAPGYSFFVPQRGVRAHIQHLIAYASKEMPKQELVDPRFMILVEKYPEYQGSAIYWPDLNGKWAVPGTYYGQDILRLWREAQSFDYSNSPLAQAVHFAETNSGNIAAWEEVYRTARKLGNYRVAIRACNEILHIDNRNVTAYINLGDMLREWGKSAEAINQYDTALQVDPNCYAALTGKAYLLAVMGDYQQAVGIYSRILQTVPEDTIALYNHGCISEVMGNHQVSEADFKKLLELCPDNVQVQKAWTLLQAQ